MLIMSICMDTGDTTSSQLRSPVSLGRRQWWSVLLHMGAAMIPHSSTLVDVEICLCGESVICEMIVLSFPPSIPSNKLAPWLATISRMHWAEPQTPVPHHRPLSPPSPITCCLFRSNLFHCCDISSNYNFTQHRLTNPSENNILYTSARWVSEYLVPLTLLCKHSDIVCPLCRDRGRWFD